MPALRDPRQKALLEALSARNVGSLGSFPLVSSHLHAMRELASSGRAALRRSTYDPGHFTASAFVLDESGSELLLIRHSKLCMWLQPGGHIEPADRDIVAAARREVEEETGLRSLELRRSIFDVDVHEIPAFSGEPAHLHFDIRVLFVTKEIVVTGSDDAEDARWFSLEEIARKCRSETGRFELSEGLPTDASVCRVARRLIESGGRIPQDCKSSLPDRD
jgi:8-oxo-dGTP pyrophosphatase MutT (NUDIX family)